MTKSDFYCRFFSDEISQYFTVMLEKALKHISIRFISSIPHRGRFIASSSAAMYLKTGKSIVLSTHTIGKIS